MNQNPEPSDHPKPPPVFGFLEGDEKTKEDQHLSEDEIYDCLLGNGSEENQKHFGDCYECYCRGLPYLG